MELNSFFINKLGSDFTCTSHSHDYWEILYVAGSSGYVKIGAEIFPFADGDVVVHSPNTFHICYNRAPSDHYCMGLSGLDLNDLRDAVFAATPELRRLFERIIEETVTRRPRYRSFIELLAQEAGLSIMRYLVEDRGNSTTEVGAASVRAVIDKHYREKIDLNFLSDQVLLSKDYLRHKFKNEYGMSPIQYIIIKRVEEAKKLLRTTALPVKAISFECGFEDEYYFSRAFRKTCGLSPLQFRQQS